MSVIRVNKSKDYTTMSNYHFKDKRITLKAKGLLSQMLSLPENWDYSINGLVAINRESEASIKSALDELKEYRYLIITKKMPNETESGRIEYVYDIYEKPKQEGEKQEVENQGVEFQEVENQGQYNINNKITNNKIIYYNNKELNDLFLEFLEVRKKKKAVNSERAVNMLLNKLSGYDDETKYKMIEKSIVNSWKDVYELKDEKLPQWFKKENNSENISEEEQKELEDLLNEIGE